MPLEDGQGPVSVPSYSSRRPTYTGNGVAGLRTPWWDNDTHILILLIVLIPIAFTVILCVITYCIYRYNKSRSDRAPTNSPIVPTDRSGGPIATVIYNTQHSPFIVEESPPSYDSLTTIKKDPHLTTDQVQLTILPNTTLTNSNREVTSASAILPPSAPIQPPPSYINLDEANK